MENCKKQEHEFTFQTGDLTKDEYTMLLKSFKVHLNENNNNNNNNTGITKHNMPQVIYNMDPETEIALKTTYNINDQNRLLLRSKWYPGSGVNLLVYELKVTLNIGKYNVRLRNELITIQEKIAIEIELSIDQLNIHLKSPLLRKLLLMRQVYTFQTLRITLDKVIFENNDGPSPKYQLTIEDEFVPRAKKFISNIVSLPNFSIIFRILFNRRSKVILTAESVLSLYSYFIKKKKNVCRPFINVKSNYGNDGSPIYCCKKIDGIREIAILTPEYLFVPFISSQFKIFNHTLGQCSYYLVLLEHLINVDDDASAAKFVLIDILYRIELSGKLEHINPLEAIKYMIYMRKRDIFGITSGTVLVNYMCPKKYDYLLFKQKDIKKLPFDGMLLFYGAPKYYILKIKLYPSIDVKLDFFDLFKYFLTDNNRKSHSSRKNNKLYSGIVRKNRKRENCEFTKDLLIELKKYKQHIYKIFKTEDDVNLLEFGFKFTPISETTLDTIFETADKMNNNNNNFIHLTHHYLILEFVVDFISETKEYILTFKVIRNKINANKKVTIKNILKSIKNYKKNDNNY